ncbi:MAG TPA: ABC transporter permease [Caldilineae bacterium]|nr:ABC transporter permease [Caldilineae bacterium]
MSLRRTLAILRKEFHHIARDPRLLFLVTFSPAFLLLTFSYVFAMDLGQVTMAVLNQDRGRLSRDYLAALTADGDVRLVQEVASYEEADQLLVAGQVDVVLVIPPGFEEDALGGHGAQVQLLVDGSDTNIARQTIGEFSARTSVFAAKLPTPGITMRPFVEPVTRVLYNPGLKSLISMVPGLMAVVLIMPALALTLALTREKEVGTFETLITTPVRGTEYLIGKLTAYITAGLVSAAIALLVALLWFHVPFRGRLAELFLLTIVYYGASMGLSLVLASFIKNQQTAMFVMLLVSFVPSFFISGLVIPIDKTSLGSAAMSYSLPTTHFIAITRGIFLKGARLSHLWMPAIALGGMGSIALALSVLLFKKRVD